MHDFRANKMHNNSDLPDLIDNVGDAEAEDAEPIGHRLDVYLVNGQLSDVRLDGESVYPTWFKIEWKESGELSAKVKGVRLATRYGDSITIHQGR
ncbi:MAG: hypothetical protein JOZ81_00650 [Chloroflexi bacterium]|nr:hypothetical protein [Chloroflexota bacterium]